MTSAERPMSLRVAAVLAGLQGALLVAAGVGYGIRGLRDEVASQAGAEVGALLIVAAGTGLLLAARGLLRRARWARAPVVAVQLLAALTGLSLLSSRLRGPAVLVVAVAVVTTAALLAPGSRRALDPQPSGPE